MEENKVVDIKDFKREERRRKIKAKVDSAMKWGKDRFNDAKEFYEDNKEFLNAAIIPAGLFVWKIISKSNKRTDDTREKELYVWDASLGRWWRLRRPLRMSEQLEFDRRKSEGESVGNILSSMRVL